MSILRARSAFRNLPSDEFDDEPFPQANPVASAYQIGRQLGVRTEISRAPSGYSEEEARAFLDGLRDGRLARHHSDCDLDWDVYESALDWPLTEEIDEVLWAIS